MKCPERYLLVKLDRFVLVSMGGIYKWWMLVCIAVCAVPFFVDLNPIRAEEGVLHTAINPIRQYCFPVAYQPIPKVIRATTH